MTTQEEIANQIQGKNSSITRDGALTAAKVIIDASEMIATEVYQNRYGNIHIPAQIGYLRGGYWRQGKA